MISISFDMDHHYRDLPLNEQRRPIVQYEELGVTMTLSISHDGEMALSAKCKTVEMQGEKIQKVADELDLLTKILNHAATFGNCVVVREPGGKINVMSPEDYKIVLR